MTESRTETPWRREAATLIVTEPEPGIAMITLNRPDTLNAMTPEMFAELAALTTDLEAADELRAVIITGAGRGFCSGFDLAQADRLLELGPLGMLRLQERATAALAGLRSLRVPVIAAVNGPASGGGLSLALVADIRLAAPTARFNAAFVRIGLSAGDLGASWLLTRLIGPARSAELCFTGRLVEADEAERMGLVNRVSAPDRLIDDALDLARAIKANSPGGVQLSKRALQANLEVGSYAAAIELENRGQALLFQTADMAEALAAFRDKRPADFVGN